jgi:hypothetical protein
VESSGAEAGTRNAEAGMIGTPETRRSRIRVMVAVAAA